MTNKQAASGALRAILFLVVLSVPAACAGPEQEITYAKVPRYFTVPYVPTPPEVVTAMLELGGTGPSDVVYDLGAGDGRIPIAAVREFNARKAVGLEIDPSLVDKANANAARAGVSARVRIKKADIYDTDFSEATIVTMYLAEDANKVLRPRLETLLAPGSRIVSHLYKMGDWEPEKKIKVGDRSIYLWTVR
jgi:precorrin-6B methylase 2